MPGAPLRARATTHYAPLIQKAMRNGLTGTPAAIRDAVAAWQRQQSVKAASATARAISRQAVNQYVKVDTKALKALMGQVYREGGYIGTAYSTSELGDKAADTELAKVGLNFPWDEWEPGSPPAADVFSGSKMATVLGNLDITIKGISATTTNRIGNTIADGLEAGKPSRAIAADLRASINALANDPQRAALIAETETNRAYNAAAVDQYQSAGLTQFNWQDYEGACPICEEYAADNPHDLGDPLPPAHPSCRCAVLGVVALS